MVAVKTSLLLFCFFNFAGFFFFFFPLWWEMSPAKQGEDLLICIFWGAGRTPQINQPSNQLFAPKSSFPSVNIRGPPQLFPRFYRTQNCLPQPEFRGNKFSWK